MPALWSMFDSIYRAARDDPQFKITIVAVPCMHPNLAPGHYSDLGMFEYLSGRGIDAIRGYLPEQDAWLTPESLAPDFVFFQTPYNLFPERWSAEYTSAFAKVCYVPYGTTLFKGEVDAIVHPESFFRAATLVFAENATARDRLVDRFKATAWFREDKFMVSGSPKLDFPAAPHSAASTPWKRGTSSKNTRILWTPRWWTNDGSCHFFDYKDHFSEFCKSRLDVDFVFRPHPLSIQNFLNTGELAQGEWERMETFYADSANMAIDKSGDYQDTFLTSSILISDISSMMIEYLVTGKPIVYTHRVDLFNEIGRSLAEGMYWVRTADELTETLNMLISGSDPLQSRRLELLHSLTFMPQEGAGTRIKGLLKLHFTRNAETPGS
jgi:hypothetical protein